MILEKNEQRKEKEQRLEEHMIRTRYEADRRLLQQMMDGNEQVFPRLKEMGFPENGQWQACWIVQAWSMAEKNGYKRGSGNLFFYLPDFQTGNFLCS